MARRGRANPRGAASRTPRRRGDTPRLWRGALLSQRFLVDGPAAEAAATLILAHGAGAGAASPFMTAMARHLAEAGLRTLRFEFPYMARRRHEGGKRPPDRLPVLLAAWREAVAEARAGWAGPLVIGGKSMGGRIASLVADELAVTGLVCLGYPFHPPGRPERPRIEHLARLRTPTLIVQGTRDPFGRPDEVAAYPLSAAVRVAWIAEGDHSLAPPKRSSRSHEATLAEAAAAIVAFVRGLV